MDVKNRLGITVSLAVTASPSLATEQESIDTSQSAVVTIRSQFCDEAM